MKKVFWLIILIAVLGTAIIFLKGNIDNTGKEDVGVKESDENQNGQEEILLFSTSTVAQSDGFYHIDAEYPKFTNASVSFNDKIADLIAERISSFKKEAKDNWDARNAALLPGEEFSENPFQPFDFIANWTPAQINDKYISFVMNIYYYVGGAHGAEEAAAFNYDLKNKKEVSINDFLGQSQQSLEKLSELSIAEVSFKLELQGIQIDRFSEEAVKAGTLPNAENFRDFNFTSDSLIIYFQKYQVAPGAAGAITITISKNELAENGIKSAYLN
jgi:hypothetical protein